MNERYVVHLKSTVNWKRGEWGVRDEFGNKMAIGRVNIIDNNM